MRVTIELDDADAAARLITLGIQPTDPITDPIAEPTPTVELTVDADGFRPFIDPKAV